MNRRERTTRALLASIALFGVAVGGLAVSARPALAAPGQLTLTPNGASGTMQFKLVGGIGKVVVQGIQGEQLTIATSAGTFTDNCGLQLTFFKPNGKLLDGPVCGGQGGAVSSASLPSSGLYRATLAPATGTKGTVTVNATTSGGPPSVTPGAAPLTTAISSPGQRVRLGFSATAGQHFAASTSNGTLPDCNVSLRFVDRQGHPVGQSVDGCAGTDGFVDAVFQTPGVYSVLLRHNSAAETGTVAVRLDPITDIEDAITLDGPSVPVAIATPGQNARYDFAGTTGTHVSALLTDSTFGPACPSARLSLIRPDGTVLGATTDVCGSTGFLDSQTLDQDGTWSVAVDPQGNLTGTATLQAFDAKDQTGPVLTDGTATSVATTTPGQNSSLHFFGSIDQQITAQVTASTFTGCPAFDLDVVRPDGTVLGSVSSCTDNAQLGPLTLDQVGQWEVVFDPRGPATGTATVQVTVTGDEKRPVALNGAAVNVNLNPGQNGEYTFPGTVGLHISAAVSASTFAGCPGYTMYLVRPDNSHFGVDVGGCGTDAFLDSQALDQDGTWAVAIVPTGGGGTAKLKAYSFDDETATADLTGKAVKLTLKKPGQNGRQTFSGTTGQRISALVTNSDIVACPAVALSLVRPDGTTLGAPVSTCTDTAFLDAQTLDQTGTWTVLVDPEGPNTGTLNVQVYAVVDSVQTLKPKGPIASFTSTVPGENAQFTFTGLAGANRTVTISGSTFQGCPAIVVSFVRPDGGVLSSTNTCTGNLVLGPSTLDADGTWTVFIDPQGAAKGTLIIKLT